MEATIKSQEQHLQGIAQLLVHANLLKAEKALEYQKAALANQQTLLQYLVTQGLFCAQKLALVVAKNYALPLIDLDCIDIDSIPGTLINEHLIHRHQIVPLFTRGNHLFFATDDPGKPFFFKRNRISY